MIRSEGARISHIANGQITTDAAAPMAERLAALQAGLAAVIAAHLPARAAAEEIFVNKNPQSTLKLAQARGAVWRMLPVNVAVWALGGFFLSLGPSLVREVSGLKSSLIGGALVATLTSGE